MLDTNVWIDHFRSSTSKVVRDQVDEWIASTEIQLVAPVVHELMAGAPSKQRGRIASYFGLLDVIPVHEGAWEQAVHFGQKCVDKGTPVGLLDLVIATCSIANGLHLITFDRDFLSIAAVSPLKMTLLTRAG